MNNELMLKLQKALNAEEELYGLLVTMRQFDLEAGRTFTMPDLLERVAADMAALNAQIEAVSRA